MLADRAGGNRDIVMIDKVSAARRRAAFLRALSETGSVTLAAERAGGDRSAFYARRRKDRVFAADWEAALERARTRLAGGREPAADDSVVWSSTRGRPRVTRIEAAGKWTARAEGAFLAELAATGNVKAACAAAGFSTTAVYQRRLKWPAFRERWAEALDEGYARIEALLVARATNLLDPPEAGTRTGEEPAMSVGEAMNLLRLHRANVKDGAGRRAGGRHGPKEPTIEDVRDEVLRRLAAMRRHREEGSGEGAA